MTRSEFKDGDGSFINTTVYDQLSFVKRALLVQPQPQYVSVVLLIAANLRLNHEDVWLCSSSPLVQKLMLSAVPTTLFNAKLSAHHMLLSATQHSFVAELSQNIRGR